METEAGKRQRYNYNIKGKTVCQEAWKLCYRISNGRPTDSRNAVYALCLKSTYTKFEVGKENWLKQKEIHLMQQSCERKRYCKHQNKANNHPKRYLSIITDGMDQAKTNLPHFYIPSKLEGQFGDFLKLHVNGVLSHGNRLSWCFLDIVRSCYLF
ncbi:hypothetical protein QZH41_016876 [Actinostola sp. cb2023]|nr:hypothetical protein QZH41_016876 [Actinostola sp. cb2023]